eukprot:scaffold3169_cov107-Cylindrotheca_fusiformis.AAC.5
MFGFGGTPQHGGIENNTKAASVNEILAAELEKLSLKEREKVYEDVHGVSDVVQETPELIASCLQQMDHEINLIKKKDAYEQAKLQSFSFVHNRQFRLAFLRCTSFNPRTAASHLVQYFSKRLEIFGTEKLTKSSINLDDIGEKATRVVELGSMQILPNRDSQGRAVVVSMPVGLEPAMTAYDEPVPIMAMANVCYLIAIQMKAFWYLMSTLAEDEETQKKGVVFVSNRVGLSERHKKCHRACIWEVLAIGQVLPLRLACLHYYYNSSSPLLPVLASAAKSIIRVRIRTHNGRCSTRYTVPYIPSPQTVFPRLIQRMPVQADVFWHPCPGVSLHRKWLY